MLSFKNVCELIDETEIQYRRCFEILANLKDTSIKISVESLLEFQPILASTLFKLDKFYRKIHQEQQHIISRKLSLSPKWFEKRLATLEKYRKLIKETMVIGKGIGDSFAWVFYQKDSHQLRKHFEHQEIFHTPPGIGGLGELEFIKRTPFIENKFVIYHGITNFLRIGDFSLYDIPGGRVTAIGEIKTEKIGENELSSSIYILAATPFKESENIKYELSKNKKIYQPHAQKLKRQIEEMKTVLKTEDPKYKKDVMDAYHVEELNKISAALDKSHCIFQKTGDGLLIIGIRNPNNSLSRRLTKESEKNKKKALNNVIPSTLEIMDNSTQDNSLYIGAIELFYKYGSTPIFWWPTNIDFIRQLFFKEITLLTLYNPLHFIRKIESIGFTVTMSNNGRSMKITKKIENNIVSFENSHYYLNMIQSHFMKEDSIVNIFKSLLDQFQKGELPLNSRIDFNMVHHLSI